MIWGLAILGIVLNSIDIKKFKVFSMICYLLMGWCIIIKANILPELLGKKYKYAHSIFHLFILLGSFLQFLCILLYVM